ncbi:MAG: hypothetical protein COC16_03930 [Lutibacter sp.]|nr:MAG: hypothetical protein COC16_03930 [Lutibacter sp.]
MKHFISIFITICFTFSIVYSQNTVEKIATSFWFSNKVEKFTKEHGNINKVKLFLLVSGKEGEKMVSGTKIMKKLLLDAGFKHKNLKTIINPNGAHNEVFWKSEFLNVVNWLYNIK